MMPYDDSPLLPESLPEDLSDPDEEFICPDPELRTRALHGYLNRSLSDAQQREFEQHLSLCLKCREDVDYLHWTGRQFQARRFPSLQRNGESPIFSPDALYDFAKTDLLPVYHDHPLTGQLAAASSTVSGAAFPITVEYAQGQVIGEFWKRVGDLFFHLKRSTIHSKKVRCILIYRAVSAGEAELTFEFQEGEQKRLGPFQQFAASETIEDVARAIKRFQLMAKPEK